MTLTCDLLTRNVKGVVCSFQVASIPIQMVVSQNGLLITKGNEIADLHSLVQETNCCIINLTENSGYSRCIMIVVIYLTKIDGDN